MKNVFKQFLKSAAGLACIVFLLNSCQASLTEQKKPDETISLERAQSMYRAYQPRFEALTELREGKEEARYGWQSLAFFKSYIAYLEYESQKINVQISGLRLYYAAYPDEDSLSHKQAGYQTYMFIPTYYDEATDTHIAFDPLHTDEAGNPIRIHDILVSGKSLPQRRQVGMVQFKKTALLQEETESSFANMAQMCPHNCE